MENFIVNNIGMIKVTPNGAKLELNQQYAPALHGLDGFSHLNVLWWFSLCDTVDKRNQLSTTAPYKTAPALMGTFATRSPCRPNPIALSCVEIISIDYSKATIAIAYIDAQNNTPILDIKPYTPSLDRVENPTVPNWCVHWPKSYEQSSTFNWESIFHC